MRNGASPSAAGECGHTVTAPSLLLSLWRPITPRPTEDQEGRLFWKRAHRTSRLLQTIMKLGHVHAEPAARQQIQARLEAIAEHDTSGEVRSDAQQAIEWIA